MTTPYERVVAERLQAEAAGIALPSRDRWVPTRSRGSVPWPVLGAATALLIVLSTVVILGDSTQAPVGRALATLRALVRPQAQTVPATWNVFVSEGLVIAAPPEFGDPRPADVPIMLGPNAPTLVRRIEFARGLSILVWKGTVRQFLDESWLRGQQQPYTRRPLTGLLSGEEVITTVIGQSDPVGGRPSGTDQARSLFVQVSPDQIAHVFLGPTGAAAPGTATTISTADRAVQDQIANLLRLARDTDTNVDAAEAERILRREVGRLQNADIPNGDPNVTKIFSGQQTVYTWSNSSKSFAYVVVYPDRGARERDSGERTVSWSSPVVQRGVGNVLVLVGSEDPNLRYRVITALDELAK